MIASGHDYRQVMSYTPKQIDAFVTIATARRRRELFDALVVQRVANHGDRDAVRKVSKELDPDAG